VSKPEVPIEVDAATGEWAVDGIPMILMPRHFFINNHAAIESALGREKYAALLYEAGYRSAYTWCEKEAATHQLQGVEVFHHYMKRLSQRGWAQFKVEALDADSGAARVRVAHSVFVAGAGGNAGGKACYMFSGWFPGSLEYAGKLLGKTWRLSAQETQCAADGEHEHCIFKVDATA
jgi:predicted hydrocarbon binding protein